MKLYYLMLFSFLMCVMTGCQQQRLVVETYYISPADLASSIVGTPDPRQYYPTTGQELKIYWRLPEFDYDKELYLLLSIRFKNRQLDTRTISIDSFRGCYTYCLHNEDYWDCGGIITYKVELFSGDCLLDSWYHQIWSEDICFDAYDEEERILDGPAWQL